MIVKEKKVFYCSHCKKYRLSRPAMEKHERHCTMNPERVCRWRGVDEHVQVDLRFIVARLRNHHDSELGEAVVWLRKTVDGCPACMLSALRQSGLDYHRWTEWHYEDEVEQWRKDQRQAEDDAEHARLQASWL